MIALSCLWELVCIYIHIPEMLYRLLFFRYFFLIYLGYMWVEKGILLDNIRLLLSVVSIAFILMFAYTSTSNPQLSSSASFLRLNVLSSLN